MSALTPNDRMRAEREISRIIDGVLRAQCYVEVPRLPDATAALTGALIDQYLEPVVEDLSAIIDDLRGEQSIAAAFRDPT